MASNKLIPLIVALLCAAIIANSTESSVPIFHGVDLTYIEGYSPEHIDKPGVLKASPFIRLVDDTHLVVKESSAMDFNRNTQHLRTKEEVIQGSKDSSGVKAGFKYSNFKIGASHDESSDHMTRELAKGETEFVSTSITISTKTTMIVPDASIMAPEFVKAVEELPDSYERTPYLEFIRIFGIVYIQEQTKGGMLRRICTLFKQLSEKYRQEGKSVEQGAEFSFFIDINAKKSEEEYKNITSNYMKLVSSQTTHVIGGEPSLALGKDFEKYIESIKTTPRIIRVKLEPLTALFNEKYLPKATNLSKKRRNFDRAIGDYLNGDDGTCEDNCNQPHGTCISDRDRGFSYCRCNPGYTGFSCSYERDDTRDCIDLVVETVRPPSAIGPPIFEVPLCVPTSPEMKNFTPYIHYVYKVPGKSTSGGCLTAYTIAQGRGLTKFEESRGLSGSGNHTLFAMYSTRRNDKGEPFCETSGIGIARTSVLGFECKVEIGPTSHYTQGFSCSATKELNEGEEISMSSYVPDDVSYMMWVKRPFIPKK